MKKESRNKLLIITIFAVAMGFLEAAVVIYLRKLFYSGGFDFPLRGFLEPAILHVEWIREFATIIMLLAIAMLAGKKFYQRFAYFLYAFAIWDIFYYISLRLTLGWPASIFTWDLLFLIPWPWIAPILAPLLCNVLFITISLLIIKFKDKGINVKIKAKEWILMIAGLFLVLYTWLYDYGKIIFGGGYAKDFFTLATNQNFIEMINSYSPSYFNWPIFLLGFMLAAIGILLFYLRTKNQRKQ
jgi:hypothetical protein